MVTFLPLADPKLIEDVARMTALRATHLLDSPAEDAFDRWTELAARLIGVPTTLISLVDEHRQFFKSAVGLPEPWASKRETPLSHSFCQHAVASGEMLAVEDAREHPLVHDNLAVTDLGVLAYAGAPLKDSNGLTLGVLCAIDDAPRRWTAQELATLEALSKSVMNEIALRTTIQRLAKSEADARRQSLLLNSVVGQMDDALAVIDMHDRVLINNESANRMRRMYVGGELTLTDVEGRRIGWEDRPIRRALRGETLNSVVVREEARGFPSRWLSIHARPLLDEKGAQIGALSTARDITQMQGVQEELRLLNDRLREQSFADELTGLYNRRGFTALASQELKVSLRAKRNAVVFLIDLDGMKQINDRLGHEAGDGALLEAASVLRNTFRDSDIPARMGGDEFSVLAIEANEEQAALLVKRLQSQVAEANAASGRAFSLAMSAGYAVFHPDSPRPLADLITLADEAMYADKQRRRGLGLPSVARP
jgi:diguanylate cyclase (GGDEF)-like protein